jgi:hypothetical protein
LLLSFSAQFGHAAFRDRRYASTHQARDGSAQTDRSLTAGASKWAAGRLSRLMLSADAVIALLGAFYSIPTDRGANTARFF